MENLKDTLNCPDLDLVPTIQIPLLGAFLQQQKRLLNLDQFIIPWIGGNLLLGIGILDWIFGKAPYYY